MIAKLQNHLLGTSKNWPWRGLGPHPLQLPQWVSLVSPRGTRIFRGALQKFRGGTTVSALQVVCILYVGVQLLLPGQDAGIDFALAKGMANGTTPQVA